MNKKILPFIIFVASWGLLKAQPVVDLFNVQEVTLKNGVKVILYGKAYSIDESKAKYSSNFRPVKYNTASVSRRVSDGQRYRARAKFIDNAGEVIAAKDNEYYYLPTNLRLSRRGDTGVPEFLFLKYVTEEREDQGGISGALIHFLMEWGLDEAQRKECETILQTRVKGAKVVGPVMVDRADGETFNIISATVAKDNKDFTRSLITSGQAPLLPGQKIAAASNLTKYGAQLLAATFNKSSNNKGGQTSITDLSVNLKFKYQARIPACKGKVVINWSKIATAIDSYYSTKTTKMVDPDCNGFFGCWGDWLFGETDVVDKVSKTDHSSSSSSSSSYKAVDIKFEENYTDDRVSAIREAFMKIITDMIGKALEIDEEPLISNDDKAMEEKRKGETDALDDAAPNYEYIQTRTKEMSKRGYQVLDLNVGLMVPREYFITENLAAWYDEVKDNKSCITSVNLNDPFYKHLDIRFVLDLEAKEMFEKEVNYVTVNVKKNRQSGNPFLDRLTFDQKYVTEKGITAAMTFAAGEDKNPDIYEYQTQWSLRGGNLFPPTPVWQKGQLEAVTLVPPITPKTITFEANMDDLKAANLVRATLQVRYMKFGKETEENIPVSVSKNEASIDKMIFMDRSTKGYAYRIVYNHTEEGKLATEWDRKINDNYVYATIPEKFKDKESDEFQKAKEAARAIIPPSADGTVTSDKVLDGFKEIFGVVKDMIKK